MRSESTCKIKNISNLFELYRNCRQASWISPSRAGGSFYEGAAKKLPAGWALERTGRDAKATRHRRREKKCGVYPLTYWKEKITMGKIKIAGSFRAAGEGLAVSQPFSLLRQLKFPLMAEQ